ncbi:MAG: transglutaminase TgpA family protein, partial [Chloroflexota bacterium]
SWLTFFLLVLLQGSVVVAIQEAGWMINSDLLVWVSLTALVTGTLLARLRIPEEVIHFFSLLLGIATLAVAGASTLAKGTLSERIVTIWERVVKWLEVTRAGGVGTDNLLFLLFLAMLAWFLGYLGAWYAFRRNNAWAAALGTGTALVVAVSYGEILGRYFFVYAPAAVLLFAHVHGGRRQQEWEEAGIRRSPNLRRSFLGQGVIAAALLVVLGAWSPNISSGPEFSQVWQLVERPWIDMQSELARYFGPVQVGTAGASTYGPTMALQGGVNLTDASVLEVKSPDPHRLRGVVYDRYTGQGWTSLERDRVDVPAKGTALEQASGDLGRKEVEQIVRVLRTKGDLLFGASLPKSVSLAVRAEIDNLTAGQGGGDTVTVEDLGAVRAAIGPYRGQEYTITSAVSVASAEELRVAGNDYPQRVWQRYTALPRSVPTRVRQLAQQLTRGKANSFDKAVAIQDYLRTLTYTLKPPMPPQGRDVVEYFLFDTREGYCDYFSSSMVVMLRSLGIPARVVAGYLPGNWDPDLQVNVVRESDSHSWPEVYFPQYGWIEFEPTASTPQVDRPQTIAEAQALINQDTNADTPVDSPQPQLFEDPTDSGVTPADASATSELGGLPVPILPREVVLSTLAALLMALALTIVGAFLWNRHFRGLQPAEAVYGKMAAVAGWAGRGRRPHQTPFEYAESLARAVPPLAPAIHMVTASFVKQRFGRRTPSADETGQLVA